MVITKGVQVKFALDKRGSLCPTGIERGSVANQKGTSCISFFAGKKKPEGDQHPPREKLSAKSSTS